MLQINSHNKTFCDESFWNFVEKIGNVMVVLMVTKLAIIINILNIKKNAAVISHLINLKKEN